MERCLCANYSTSFAKKAGPAGPKKGCQKALAYPENEAKKTSGLGKKIEKNWTSENSGETSC